MWWITSVDWGGNAPPATWYRRLSELGVVDHSDNQIAVAAKKIQEGVYVTTTRSLALIIAGIAMRGFQGKDGSTVTPARVQVYEANPVEVTPTNGLHTIMQRVDRTLGKRGRKPKPSPRVVTCFDDAQSNEMMAEGDTIQCPQCGSLQVLVRYGKTLTLADPDSGDVVSDWARLRFATGQFEIPVLSSDGDEPPAEPVTDDPHDATYVAGLGNTPIAAQMRVINVPNAERYALLDAAYIVSRHHLPERRRKGRDAAILEAMSRGFLGVEYREPSGGVDLLSLGGQVVPEKVVDYWQILYHLV